MGAEQSTTTTTEEEPASADEAPAVAPELVVLGQRLAAMEGANDGVTVQQAISGAITSSSTSSTSGEEAAPAVPVGLNLKLDLPPTSTAAPTNAMSLSNGFVLLTRRTLAKLTSALPTTDQLLSWRPTSPSKSVQGGGPKRGKGGHNDPKHVFEGMDGAALQAALNEPKRLHYMLQGQTKTDVKDADGDRCALHWAAARGHLRCIHLLVEAGADKSITDASGRTPAELALELGQQLAHDLLVYGVPLQDPKVLPILQGRTLLTILAGLNQPTQLETALKDPSGKYHFKVNQKDEDGDRTPLHWAAARGHIKCIEVLLSAGADASLADASGCNAVALARLLNQRAAASTIEDYKAAAGEPQTIHMTIPEDNVLQTV